MKLTLFILAGLLDCNLVTRRFCFQSRYIHSYFCYICCSFFHAGDYYYTKTTNGEVIGLQAIFKRACCEPIKM